MIAPMPWGKYLADAWVWWGGAKSKVQWVLRGHAPAKESAMPLLTLHANPLAVSVALGL